MNFAKTLVVNLVAGSGAAKSAIAAGVFHDLKFQGVEVELVTEFAKDLIWSEQYKVFKNQIKIFAEQYTRIYTLIGKVEVIVTDSPLLLTPIWDNRQQHSLKNMALEEYWGMWNYTVFVKRKDEFYNPHGRNEKLEEAKKVDRKILDLMERENIPYETVDAGPIAKDYISKKILKLLGKDLCQ